MRLLQSPPAVVEKYAQRFVHELPPTADGPKQCEILSFRLVTEIKPLGFARVKPPRRNRDHERDRHCE